LISSSFLPPFGTSSSNEESSSSLQEEISFVFLPFAFALSFLFLVVSLSRYLMRSSKVEALEAPVLESSSMMTGLSSSSNFGGISSSYLVLDITSQSG
jgi:hypothetical protein